MGTRAEKGSQHESRRKEGCSTAGAVAIYDSPKASVANCTSFSFEQKKSPSNYTVLCKACWQQSRGQSQRQAEDEWAQIMLSCVCHVFSELAAVVFPALRGFSMLTLLTGEQHIHMLPAPDDERGFLETRAHAWGVHLSLGWPLPYSKHQAKGKGHFSAPLLAPCLALLALLVC